jgi:hypothetical protein
MEAGQYVRRLAEFVSGEIGLPEFRQLVEERLFELRQSSEMTDEKRVLSSIELHLHEAEEGLRNEGEVYAHVQFVLDDILLLSWKNEGSPIYLSSASPKLPYSLSRKYDVDDERKLPLLTKDVSLATAK